MRLPSTLSAKLGLIGGTLLVPASIGLTRGGAWQQRTRGKLKVLYRQETTPADEGRSLLARELRESIAQHRAFVKMLVRQIRCELAPAGEHAAECSP